MIAILIIITCNLITGCGPVLNALGPTINLARIPNLSLSVLGEILVPCRTNCSDVLSVLYNCPVLGTIRPNMFDVQAYELFALHKRPSVPPLLGIHRGISNHLLYSKVLWGKCLHSLLELISQSLATLRWTKFWRILHSLFKKADIVCQFSLLIFGRRQNYGCLLNIIQIFCLTYNCLNASFGKNSDCEKECRECVTKYFAVLSNFTISLFKLLELVF